MSLLFVLSQYVLAQLSSTAVLFHVNDQLLRAWPIKGQLSGKLTLFFKLSMVSLWPVICLSGEISDISTNLIFL